MGAFVAPCSSATSHCPRHRKVSTQPPSPDNRHVSQACLGYGQTPRGISPRIYCRQHKHCNVLQLVLRPSDPWTLISRSGPQFSRIRCSSCAKLSTERFYETMDALRSRPGGFKILENDVPKVAVFWFGTTPDSSGLWPLFCFRGLLNLAIFIPGAGGLENN